MLLLFALVFSSSPELHPQDSGGRVMRDVLVGNGVFTNTTTGTRVVLTGANVVVKGFPWLPTTDGDAVCDTPANPTHNTSCRTFNHADAAHLTNDLGYNFIRLGVTWAGGQPTSADVRDRLFFCFFSFCNRLLLVLFGG